MFGHGCPLVEPDLRVGEGVGVVLVDAGAVVDGVELVELDGVAAADVAAVVCVAGAAEALAMPAAAPAVASAPATIVAPSILEMVIGSDLLEVEWWMVQAIVRDRAKHHRRWA
jgi:hypothetical protein